jgi:hypothetical protein
VIIRNLDSLGDWRFGKGLQSYARDEQAVEVNVATRLRSWIGDCFFALQDGIDWRSRLDIGQEEALKEELKACILQSYGVVSVDSVTLTKDADRRVIVAYQMSTIFGQGFTGALAQA